MRQLRSPLAALVAVAAIWTVAVVFDVGLRTGAWSLAVRHTLLLGSAAGLIGLVAAMVDDLIEDFLSGGDDGPGPKGGRRRVAPTKVRVPRRPRRRPGR